MTLENQDKKRVRIPNSEQMIAINHAGGKILSAGAGSGKTFVLIEHIITWLDNLRLRTPASEWQHVIPFQLPKLVLMTFTKKAAGEMSIRMMNRIDNLCDEQQDSGVNDFWNMVRQYLPTMGITTISSFCHKLISHGYFAEIDSDVKILSNIEFKNKISNLFNLWFISKNNNLNQVFQANSKALIEAMIGIYNSPELRILWKETIVKTSAEEELRLYVDEIIKSLELEDLFNYPLSLTADAKEKEKGWFIFLQKLDRLVKDIGPFGAKNFKAYAGWANSVGTLPREVKGMNEEQVAMLIKAKLLVKKLRDIEEDFLCLIDHYEIYWSWVEIFKEIYDFIDRNYFLEKGFAFSDLEYYVCVGLRSLDVCEKVKENYDYFIIDEFQDTSSVQYEIIQHLVGEKKQRFFCVGDKKQAIYGFRGGELLVFNQCLEELGVENNIWLKNNFRSHGKIIEFNNYFFDAIFPLGHGFEGKEINAVSMESQIIPQDKMVMGAVESFKTEIREMTDNAKVNVDAYEAEALILVVEELLGREDIENVCVLYRRLKPSIYLLDLLVRRGFSFNAQIKVQYGEDPIINLFLRSIELKLNQNDPKKIISTHFLMNTLLEVLKVDCTAADVEKKFLGDLETLGLRLAFHKLVYSLGISNSKYDENGMLIDSICLICKEDLVQVFHLLSTESAEEYSSELINGVDKKRVIVMSAHASKGLEFDAVLLGGIYSNGSQMGKVETIGKFPKSFRWKKHYKQKKFYKTPMYYLEAEIDKIREFSESKRLLYVACTRAISYLGWIDLWGTVEGKEKSFLSGANHWIRAMRLASFGQGLHQEKVLTLNFQENNFRRERSILLRDSLGIEPSIKKGQLGIFAETSVTKLVQLVQCPFKYYLATICKITPPGTDKLLFSENENEDENEDKVAAIEDVFYSSKERGTRIHHYLSQIILKKMTISEIESSNSDRDKILWAYTEAQKVATGKEVISEKQIKFSFFGQMISGTPDLVFEDSDSIIIWDFKTGMRAEKENAKEDGYWFQLMCYGYAYANLKCFTPEKMITLSLLYVDQKEIVTKSLRLEEVILFLFGVWEKTESLNQVNLSHCSSCEYAPICLHHKRSLD